MIGASGTANVPGSDGKEFLLRVPELTWGGFHMRNVLIVSRPDATYSPNHYKTPNPIEGALGGNVLRRFRVEIDYPHGETYLGQTSEEAGEDMNSAGLVLDIDGANKLVVRAISSSAAPLTKSNVRVNDVILEIDGEREKPWTITNASDALAGAIGENKRIVLRHGSKVLSTSIVISDLL